MNANTKVYGLIGIPVGPLRAIRHVVSPSVGYSWTPDFSKPLFGKNLGYVIKKQIVPQKIFFMIVLQGPWLGTPLQRKESQ